MSGRPMPFRSGDDAARAAVAPLLDELRGELLVLPGEDVVEKHLGLMAFEQRVVTRPRVERPARRVLTRPRRTAFVVGCITATIASCGLSAAGALPEPLQHITDSIARTLGVPQPHNSGTSTGAPAPTTSPTVPAAHPRSSAPTTEPASTTTPATKPVVRKPRVTTPTTEPASTTTPATTPVEAAAPPAFPARPTDPGGRIDPTPPTTTPPPSNNSQNTPPGYPTDWRDRAIQSASSQILFCSWWDNLNPVNCPQSAVAPAGAENVAWRLLSDPARTAAAVADTTKGANGDLSTLVTVYARFRMVATYTLPDTGAKQYLAYSSGIAETTMTWSGSMFDDIRMTTGSVDGNVRPGVTVPTFARPGIWDFMVSWKVQREFERCTANGAPDQTCPAGGLLDSPTTNASTQNGSVLAAAEVSFDGETGLYRVKGPYSLTPPTGPPVTGTFTATLFYDGDSLTVLGITGS